MSSHLALYGGVPVRRSPWPPWPTYDEATERSLLAALRSGRWTLSGDAGAAASLEKAFADAFARFLGVRHCVPTCNGSAAIAIALQAAGVRAGDEVLVPALTWVGCASAVLRLGAVPIFVDCEPSGLAMSPDAASAALSDRVKAILLVHPYCTNARVEAFVALSEAHGFTLVEDCSHVHGAVHEARRLGTFGQLAVFSMQQSKVLTCGEGGAVVTDDDTTFRLLQQCRSDGRVYDDRHVVDGPLVRMCGEIHGANYTLSELHSAVLLDRLGRLDEENERRRKNATILNDLLKGLAEFAPLYSAAPSDEPTLYRYVVRLDVSLLRTRDLSWWKDSLSAELGLRVERLYEPLPDARHLRPETVPSLSHESMNRFLAGIESARSRISESRRAYQRCLALPHRILMGSARDCQDVARALSKLADASRIDELANERTDEPVTVP